MKIGILGKMASGKTTLANYILNIDDEYEIYSFGDKVKSIAKDLFGMNDKNRELLQNIGTKMREINQDVWVDYLISKIKDKNKIIIDDVRYQNEIDTLIKNGFVIIYLKVTQETQINRLKIKYPESNHIDFLQHESENADKFSESANYIISDQVTEIEYKKQVEKILSI